MFNILFFGLKTEINKFKDFIYLKNLLKCYINATYLSKKSNIYIFFKTKSGLFLPTRTKSFISTLLNMSLITI